MHHRHLYTLLNFRQIFILLLLLLYDCSFVYNLSTNTSKEIITLGVLVPWTGEYPEGSKMASAATIAVEDINNDPTLLQNYTLKFNWEDDKCSGASSVGKTADLFYRFHGESDGREGVDGYIGPYCSEGCVAAGFLAAYHDKPMISYSCSSNELSKKDEFPTFARTKTFARQKPSGLGKSMISLMKRYRWKRITLLVSKKQAWHDFGQHIFEKLENLTDVDKIPYDPDTTDYKTMLTRASKKARIFALLAYYADISRILVEARRMGMFNGDYMFITIDFEVKNSWANESWMKPYTLEQAFSGFLDISVQKPGSSPGSTYANFSEDVRRRMRDPPFNHIMPDTDKVHTDAAFLYDAIYLYARAFQKTLNSGGNPYSGRDLIKHVFNADFEGKSGTVLLDGDGDRKQVYELRNFQHGSPVHICTYSKTTGKCENKKEEARVLWPGRRTGPPKDQPKCGFDNEDCSEDKNNTLIQILVIIFGIVFIVIALTVAYVYRRKKFEKDLLAEGFFVNYDEIINSGTYGGQNGRAGGSISSKVAVITGLLIFPESYSMVSDTESLTERSQFIVSYRGQHVMIKRLNRNTANINREILLEFKQVREIHHVNVCQVVGVCVQVPNVCILTQYSSKGSLQDVLQNNDIKLDWMFKMSFASDIAAGIHELHRNGIVHGRLHSNNCVIDNRWVCKITDYGMDKFKQTHCNNNEDETEYQIYRKLLWQAPELLKGENNGGCVSKSKEGDTYSFGIVLSEILTREDPYAAYDDMEPKYIVAKVRERMDPPFRPKLQEDESEVRYMNLMKSCWHDCPTQRPNFETIKSRLKRILGGRTGNLMDNMIAMMEKYTNNLEELVGERTGQLAAEKAKTDELLYKMLPKTIADQLKHGEQVAAESFDSVTIFFSDIVGFTKLASTSTPMQVVDLLNDLYTCFDKCIDNYDVYKVETIGDAYMVVSGLPQRNDIHAGEIATMSLDLLHCTKSFRIRHKPDTCLQLRIGIHTGSCVAGVVGLKMPRYCLFGDTVNYASRMESSGLALRVHVSPECKQMLDKLKGYHLIDRGPTDMKGKGTINTYFLQGKDGFDKSLPDLSKAAGLDQHEFK